MARAERRRIGPSRPPWCAASTPAFGWPGFSLGTGAPPWCAPRGRLRSRSSVQTNVLSTIIGGQYPPSEEPVGRLSRHMLHHLLQIRILRLSSRSAFLVGEATRAPPPRAPVREAGSVSQYHARRDGYRSGLRRLRQDVGRRQVGGPAAGRGRALSLGPAATRQKRPPAYSATRLKDGLRINALVRRRVLDAVAVGPDVPGCISHRDPQARAIARPAPPRRTAGGAQPDLRCSRGSPCSC